MGKRISRITRIIVLFICTVPLVCETGLLHIQSQVMHAAKAGMYDLGGLSICPDSRHIIIPARVQLCTGPLEVLLCTPAGKIHESLFVTDVSPLVLETALIALGYVPEYNLDSLTVTPAYFEIRYRFDDGSQPQPVESFLQDQQQNEPAKAIPWRFCGSPIYPNGELAAEFEGTLVSLYDLHCILINDLPTRYDDTIYSVNTQKVVPKGSPVDLIIMKKGDHE